MENPAGCIAPLTQLQSVAGEAVNISKLIAITELCRPYVAQALVRLSYLYPKAVFAVSDDGIVVEGEGLSDTSAHDVTHQVDREKIYQESSPMRELMYKALLP